MTGAMASVHSLQLSVTQWRCYAQAQWQWPGGVSAIVGPNGTGKTSFLEALSFFAPGRGLRSACNRTVQRQMQACTAEEGGHTDEATSHVTGQGVPASRESVGWQLGLRVIHSQDLQDATTLTVHCQEGRRRASMGGALIRPQSDICQWVQMIWPMEGPLDSMTQRRSTLNRLVFTLDPPYGALLSQYDKALRQRQHLLQQGERNGLWYESLEHILAETGLAIAYTRQVQVAALQDTLAHHGMTPFPKPTFGLQGEVETALAQNDLTVADYARRLAQSRALDQAKKTTHFGVHKTRFVLYHPHGRELALCSTGEQKGLILSMALATLRLSRQRHPDPVHLFLLDEVMARLDPLKQAWLWQELLALDTPVVLSALPDLQMPDWVHRLTPQPSR